MSLKSSRPARHAPGNPRLAKAIARCVREPGPEARSALLESFTALPLLLAIHELPDDLELDGGGLATVRFLTGRDSQGRRALCGFSSYRALAARAPAAVALAVDPASVLDWVVTRGAEGLLLDPAGPSAFLTRDEARQLLGLPPPPPPQRRPVSLGGQPERAVREALQLLREAGRPGDSIWIAETRTGKAVHFERSDDDTLRMVLAVTRLADDERARAALLFDELAGGAEALAEGALEKPEGADFQALFGGDVTRPAEAAVKVFAWVFGFPPGFELEIEPR